MRFKVKILALSMSLLCGNAIFAQAMAQEKVLPSVPIDVSKFVQFSESDHDFGKTTYKQPIFFILDMKNISDKKLILTNVEVSCGCTVPEWKPGPYAPGDSFSMKINYNGYGLGAYHKTIRLTFNNNIYKVIRFHGEGIEKK